jgi:hypothetical protein
MVGLVQSLISQLVFYANPTRVFPFCLPAANGSAKLNKSVSTLLEHPTHVFPFCLLAANGSVKLNKLRVCTFA